MGDDALALRLEAEAACVWHDWAAALVVAVAACVTGGDRRAVKALPDATGRPDGIVLQRGHVVDIGGGSIPQLLRIGGGRAIEAGSADRCEADEVEPALADPACAAGLFVTGVPGLMGLAPFVWRCRRAGRPAIVALRGDGDPVPALDAGAGLVVLEEAATGGIVAGEAALVAAALAQRDGIGRALGARA